MLKEKRGCHFSVSSQQCYRCNSGSQDILVFGESTFLLGEIVLGSEAAASRQRFHTAGAAALRLVDKEFEVPNFGGGDAHGSYFAPGNEAVQRDIIVQTILR